MAPGAAEDDRKGRVSTWYSAHEQGTQKRKTGRTGKKKQGNVKELYHLEISLAPALTKQQHSSTEKNTTAGSLVR